MTPRTRTRPIAAARPRTQPPLPSGADPVLERLNGLIELNRDAEAGFALAADRAVSPKLKQLFDHLRQQRTGFAEALAALVEQMGGEPARRGTLAGGAHRKWMELREILAPNGDRALVHECEGAEDASVAAYRLGLDAGLPVETHELLEYQARQIFSSHDLLSDIKHGREAV